MMLASFTVVAYPNEAKTAYRTLERKIVDSNEHRNRVALVIGNAAYQNSPLANPVNDANDIAAALNQLGFEVVLLTDQGLNPMRRAVRDFESKLNSDAVAVLFYAGHGLQNQGVNYLVPVDADINNTDDIKYQALDLQDILKVMEKRENGNNFIFLDACRNNPFAQLSRGNDSAGWTSLQSSIKGLTQIIYATKPGSTASDGNGRNGVFTSALLNHIKTPNLAMPQLIMSITNEVAKLTNKKQVVWQEGVQNDFVFFQQTIVNTTPSPNISQINALWPVKFTGTPIDAIIEIIGVGNWTAKTQLEAKPYTARIQKEGYVTQEIPFTVAQSNNNFSYRLDVFPSLALDLQPRDAIVKLSNGMNYQRNMILPPGDYMVDISKEGFEAQTIAISLQKGLLRKAVNLTELSRLFIATTPNDASIEFSDGKLDYQNGQTIAPGTYEITVKKAGYQSVTKKINIEKKRNDVFVKLNRLYELVVETIPADASIKLTPSLPLTNASTMELIEGTYTIKAEKTGFNSLQNTFLLNKNMHVKLTLTPFAPLNITTKPGNATINIDHPSLPYSAGMLLPDGIYTVTVSAPGYTSKTRDIIISNGKPANELVELNKPLAGAPVF